LSGDLLVRALLRGEPYFGSAMAALQGVPERHGYMRATVEFLARAGVGAPFRVLEVGSWAGTSAVTWAKAIEEHFASGSVSCIDTWAPFFVPAVDRGTIYQTMREAAAEGDIYRLFLHNIRASGLFLTVDHLVGESRVVLPTLPPHHYHVVFLDGSHRYPDVAADIDAGRRLVAEGGVLCGDDLELILDRVDPASHQDFLASGQDYAHDPRTGCDYHPGVTQAVAEAFPEVARYAGFWAVRRNGRSWEPIDLQGCDASVPAHVRAAAATDPGQPPPSLVGAEDHYNIVRYRGRFLALAEDLGNLDLTQERVGEREIAPRVLVGQSLEEVRAKIADARSALHRPEVRAVTTIDEYNVISIDDRFVAFAAELGPIDPRTERLGEREIAPRVLVGQSLEEVRAKIADARSALHRPEVRAVTTIDEYNVISIDDRFVAFAAELGPIDPRTERLGERDIEPMVLVGASLAEVRKKTARSRASLHRPEVQTITACEGYNLVRIDGTLAAFAEELGSIDIVTERLGNRAIPPLILVGDSIEELRDKAAENRRSLRAPQVALVGEIGGYNLVRMDGRLAALAQALGTIDLTRERLGERDIPPMILVGSTLDEIRAKIEATARSVAATKGPTPPDAETIRAAAPDTPHDPPTKRSDITAIRQEGGKPCR
jgi:hypothetical protein